MKLPDPPETLGLDNAAGPAIRAESVIAIRIAEDFVNLGNDEEAAYPRKRGNQQAVITSRE
jgi:hypothetical protein